MTVAPEIVFKPVDGDHVYDTPPLAVKVTDEPLHMDALIGEIVMFGGTHGHVTVIPIPLQVLPLYPSIIT